MLGSANKGPSIRKGCLIYIEMDPDFTLGILKTISSFLTFLLLKKSQKPASNSTRGQNLLILRRHRLWTIQLLMNEGIYKMRGCMGNFLTNVCFKKRLQIC